jgi:hypothetical protein
VGEGKDVSRYIGEMLSVQPFRWGYPVLLRTETAEYTLNFPDISVRPEIQAWVNSQQAVLIHACLGKARYLQSLDVLAIELAK